jgi:hypothetical protein
MAEKNDKPEEVKAVSRAGSAPELPHEVAREYGLHHERVTSRATHTKKSAGNDDVSPDTAELSPAAQSDTAPESDSSDAGDLNDEKTDAAVDDILTKEADDLLKVQDGNIGNHTTVVPRGKPSILKRWWRNKWARNTTIFIILAAIVAVIAIPKTRYAVLNTAGVRSSASVIVLDNTTELPLKNVAVTLNGDKAVTDHDGVAKFKELKLGDYELDIKRVAFAKHHQKITIGWGSNPLGSFKLRATGTQYTILVKDFVSGKPIEGVEANSDEAVAQSDKNGKIILTVDDTDITKLTAVVSSKGYRDEPVEVLADSTAPTQVVMVPAVKDVYVSKQSGKYDVYSSDLDGKDRKLILAGTGSENATISLVVSPDGQRAAMVSTRDNIRDDDGFILQALTIINLAESTSVTIDHAEQIQLVDWVDSRLVYRLTLAGASASNAQRNRLVSYNYDSNARIQLATANQFNAIFSVKGYVYYTASSTDTQATMGLFRIKTDGTDRKRLTTSEIWTTLRTGYNTALIQQPDGWVAYDLASGQVSKADAPSSVVTFSFADDSKNEHSLWTDTRDGSGVLLLHDVAKNTDKVLKTQDGIAYPVRWLTDKTILYRVATSNESADYAISVDGGEARKISDVTATYGYAQIY